MKRLLCIALLAAMCAGGMAEGATGAEPTQGPIGAQAADMPATFDPADAPYDGVWQPFEDGFMLYLPRGWRAVALTEAQSGAGLFYRAASDDGSMGIAVGYMRAEGLATLDDLARDFVRAGYASVNAQSLNGIPAIGFERPGDGYRGVAFFHPVWPDYALYIYLSPLAPEGTGARETADALLASLSPLEVSPERLKNIDGYAGKTRTMQNTIIRALKKG